MEELIILNTGDVLFSDENLVVFNGGTFNPTDLVLVKKFDGEIPLFQYQTIYIKTGETL